MVDCRVVALSVVLLQGCGTANDAAGAPPDGQAPPASPGSEDPYALDEAWRDSCRRWCGVQDALDRDCVKGEAMMRGVQLGTEPFPEEPRKSYDLACIGRCLAWRGDEQGCWQQAAELTECLAQNAVFVCIGSGEWVIYGCEGAGTDRALCAPI